jgi:hypothetical protein
MLSLNPGFEERPCLLVFHKTTECDGTAFGQHQKRAKFKFKSNTTTQDNHHYARTLEKALYQRCCPANGYSTNRMCYLPARRTWARLGWRVLWLIRSTPELQRLYVRLSRFLVN